MPRQASRITLEIINIRAEYLFDITEEDAKAEGVELIKEQSGLSIYRSYNKRASHYYNARGSFLSLWESINGIESLKANPCIWAVKFRVVE